MDGALDERSRSIFAEWGREQAGEVRSHAGVACMAQQCVAVFGTERTEHDEGHGRVGHVLACLCFHFTVIPAVIQRPGNTTLARSICEVFNRL